jgi:hypothetical protein
MKLNHTIGDCLAFVAPSYSVQYEGLRTPLEVSLVKDQGEPCWVAADGVPDRTAWASGSEPQMAGTAGKTAKKNISRTCEAQKGESD